MGLFDFLKKHKNEDVVGKSANTNINKSLKNSSIPIKMVEIKISNVSTTINNIEKIEFLPFNRLVR